MFEKTKNDGPAGPKKKKKGKTRNNNSIFFRFSAKCTMLSQTKSKNVDFREKTKSENATARHLGWKKNQNMVIFDKKTVF